MPIRPYDRLRLAAQAMVNEKTVARVYRGGGSDYTRARVSAAAETLGLPLPPERSTAPSPSSSPGLAKTLPTP